MIKVFFFLAIMSIPLLSFPQGNIHCFTQDTSADPVYGAVEINPVYPGGYKALYNFLTENLNYPDSAKKHGIQGTVYLSFVVEKDGKVSNVNLFRGIGGGCDEEAVRVINLMPAWTPGLCDKKPVRVGFCLPVKFNLSDSN